jgi:phosphatidyl-myo-inositol dimannoside synthase
VSRTLVVTNDFPPRPGGIQAYLHALLSRQPRGSVVVYASQFRGWEKFDAEQPFPVVRHPHGLLLPTPYALRRTREVARAEGCDTVLYGAMAPLGLLTSGLRSVGVRRFVGMTHGHEAGWAQLPVSRSVLRRIADSMNTMTYLTEYTRARIARGLSPEAAERMTWLPPGVDDDVFYPGAGGSAIRAQLGLADRPVVVCVSRLVPRKGQDVLIRAWPAVLRAVPDAALLLVGGGPYRSRLERLVEATGVRRSVILTGSVPWGDLPAYYDAGNVFAMPCRTRAGGIDVEGLGIVYLEASATGLPVVAGNSGGAPDAVLDGETGYVVDGRSVDSVVDRVTTLLLDPARAQEMGKRGRQWVGEAWRWDDIGQRLTWLLT